MELRVEVCGRDEAGSDCGTHPVGQGPSNTNNADRDSPTLVTVSGLHTPPAAPLLGLNICPIFC